jgi:prenylcysteine oxidase / farnesylcysteine lyase
MRVNKIVSDLVKNIYTLYGPDAPRWETIEEASDAAGFKPLTALTTTEYFTVNGVSKQFIHEMVEAATRVNYGQNADALHALEGAASLATDDAVGVDGGNFLIFEHFLNRSGAHVYLDTPVGRPSFMISIYTEEIT